MPDLRVTWLESTLRRCAGAALRWLAPDYCASCDAPLDAARVFCSGCGDVAAPSFEPPLGARVGGVYAPPLSTAITRMKFADRPDLAARLAALLPVVADRGEPYLIVPVPLHYSRLVQRGFNPAALLARGLRARDGGTLAIDLLRRAQETAQQSRLPAAARGSNVAGAFEARRPAQLARAVLVDDVVTTGSTFAACARALRSAGVARVEVVALAATAPPTAA